MSSNEPFSDKYWARTMEFVKAAQEKNMDTQRD